jgi:hypothetical protein
MVWVLMVFSKSEINQGNVILQKAAVPRKALGPHKDTASGGHMK